MRTEREGENMGLWTLPHLFQIIPTFFVLAVLSAVIARFLNKRDVSVRYVPLKIIAVLLLLLEVAKQINSACADGGYNMYSLPFHYCSLFIYLLPLHAFYRGKRSSLIAPVTLGCLAALTVGMLIMPAAIYTDADIIGFFSDFAKFHTLIFHNLVVFYFMLTVALDVWRESKRDVTAISVFIGAYVTLAALLSYSLGVNFHNLRTCNVPFVDALRIKTVDALGVFGTLLYVGAVLVLSVAFTVAAYYLAVILIRTVKKKK